MARLSILAQYNPLDDSSMSDVLNQSSMSNQNTAQELMTRGQNIFGAEEEDAHGSAYFLVSLLDFIEKWSQLKVVEKESIADKGEKMYTFKMVY